MAPDALLRRMFRRTREPRIRCPKCRSFSLCPGYLGGAGLWLCTPCSGFLAPAAAVIPAPLANPFSPHFHGFDEAGLATDPLLQILGWAWRRVVALWLGLS